MRFAFGVDDDLRPFYDAFRDDAVIGRAVRAHPHLRVRRSPVAWETLCAAVTEQLIELERAMEIQRRLIAALGYRCRETGLRAAPEPAALAAEAPARLVSLGLAPKRALALRRVARELASGRVTLRGDRWEHDARRLRAIPEIGRWTLEMTALHGLGRYDHLPAGDLGYLKLVGRLATGNPRARADEDEVRGFFATYGAWQGLAGQYVRLAAASGMLVTPARRSPGRALHPGGTRWSAPAPPPAAAPAAR
jgi:3-methyladenine DNA glycosylase/8-oxoguanine DNA glycosylase